jgi:hypothetical protein
VFTTRAEGETTHWDPHVLPGGEAVPYDVSIDAKRFLMMKSTSSDDRSGPTQIHVILNWFEELKERVPTGWAVRVIRGSALASPA